MVQRGLVHGAAIWFFLCSIICPGHASMRDTPDTIGNDTELEFDSFLEYDEEVIASADVDIQDIGLGMQFHVLSHFERAVIAFSNVISFVCLLCPRF